MKNGTIVLIVVAIALGAFFFCDISEYFDLQFCQKVTHVIEY